jgi:acetyl esterase
MNFTRQSYLDHEVGYGVEAAGMQWAWETYIPEAERGNQYAVPMKAEQVSGVAPAIIALAEHDVLRDEGVAYGEKLASAGVSVTLKEWPGMIHGFFGHGMYVDAAYELRKWLSAQIVELTKD